MPVFFSPGEDEPFIQAAGKPARRKRADWPELSPEDDGFLEVP